MSDHWSAAVEAMTREQAQVEAIRRWGYLAAVWQKGPVFCVGRSYPRPAGLTEWRRAQGRGDSWKAAFADADRRTR